MLINYKFKNFRNFKEETMFSFERGKKRELPEHIIKNNNYEILPIKVIYGSNSVGKSNLIKAMALLQKFIITGKIRNGEDDIIGLCSNLDSKKDYETPIEFNTLFSIDDDIYEYTLNVKNYFNRHSDVVFESLSENGDMIFERDNNKVVFSEKKSVVDKHFKSSAKFIKDYEKMLSENISNTDIFVSWYYNTDKNLCEKIKNYFINKVSIITDLEHYTIPFPKVLKEDLIKSDEKSSYTNKFVDRLLKELKQDKAHILFKKDKNSEDIITKAKYKFSDEKAGIECYASQTESKGTIKLIDLITLIIYTLDRGALLMVDELDASIHHEIIYNIIKTFGDPTINKHGAQLVFTTHNPVYMNKLLLRRDEIVFVEKNSKTSFINTLDDYDIRSDFKYLKNYLSGNLTVLPNFDLEEIIGDLNGKTSS